MFSIFKKFKWVIAILFILLFLSMFRSEPVRAPLYKQVLVTMVSPFNRIITWFSEGTVGIWDHYISLVNTSKENERLRGGLKERDLGLIHLGELIAENSRLRDLLKMGEGKNLQLVGAEIIANDPRAEFKSVTINKGYNNGIGKGMPVVGPTGLVGRVVEVGGGWARALLITDPNSAVDVIVQRSRQRAILVGAMSRTELRPSYYLTRLEYLHRTSDIRDGDVVVTSGMDGVFPRDIPVGVIQDVQKSDYGLFARALVTPFEDMSGLEEIGVVIGVVK